MQVYINLYSFFWERKKAGDIHTLLQVSTTIFSVFFLQSIREPFGFYSCGSYKTNKINSDKINSL